MSRWLTSRVIEAMTCWVSLRLRVENARLRGLLGLDDRVADGHEVAFVRVRPAAAESRWTTP